MQRLNFDEAPDVLTASQTAQILGVAPETARTLLNLGEIKGKKTRGKLGSGTKWLVPKAAVKEWLMSENEF